MTNNSRFKTKHKNIVNNGTGREKEYTITNILPKHLKPGYQDTNFWKENTLWHMVNQITISWYQSVKRFKIWILKIETQEGTAI